MELTLLATISDYKTENAADFKAINKVWIKQFESKGGSYKSLLENPDESILAKGGKIFVASVEGNLVGTCVLLRKNFKQYEICLMAVKPEFQGKNIGKQLLSHAMDIARDLQAKTIELITNPKLAAAVELYKTHGFREEKEFAHGSVLFDANDFKMTLALM